MASDVPASNIFERNVTTTVNFASLAITNEVVYIPMKMDSSILDKVCEWFPPAFLAKERIFAIQEVEPSLLKLFTRAHENVNRIGRRRGGRKVLLLGQEVFGDTFLACGRCGYHSSENSNVRKHYRREICLMDRGYEPEQLQNLNRKERVNFLQRLSSRRYRERRRSQSLRKGVANNVSAASTEQICEDRKSMPITQNNNESSAFLGNDISIQTNNLLSNDICDKDDTLYKQNEDNFYTEKLTSHTLNTDTCTILPEEQFSNRVNGVINTAGLVNDNIIIATKRETVDDCRMQILPETLRDSPQESIKFHTEKNMFRDASSPEEKLLKAQPNIERCNLISDSIEFDSNYFPDTENDQSGRTQSNEYDPVLSSSSNTNQLRRQNLCSSTQLESRVNQDVYSLNNDNDSALTAPAQNNSNFSTNVDHSSIFLVSNPVPEDTKSNLCIISMGQPTTYKTISLPPPQQLDTTVVIPCSQTYNIESENISTYNPSVSLPLPFTISPSKDENYTTNGTVDTLSDMLSTNHKHTVELPSISSEHCASISQANLLYPENNIDQMKDNINSDHAIKSTSEETSSGYLINTGTSNANFSSECGNGEGNLSNCHISSPMKRSISYQTSTVNSENNPSDRLNNDPKKMKKPKKSRSLSLGPVVLREPIERISYDLYTVSDANQMMAWKPMYCHKAPANGKEPCKIAFRGARRSRRCLSLPLPCVLLYRKLDCRHHNCHFTLFHTHARHQQAKDDTVHATVSLRIYADTVMTQDFHHYLRSLLFSCRLKPSQAARHISGVWTTVLKDRVSASHPVLTVPCSNFEAKDGTTHSKSSDGVQASKTLLDASDGEHLSDGNFINENGGEGIKEVNGKTGFIVGCPKTAIDESPGCYLDKYRSITSLSKQTVKSLWRRLEEEEETRSSDVSRWGRKTLVGGKKVKGVKPLNEASHSYNANINNSNNDTSQQNIDEQDTTLHDRYQQLNCNDGENTKQILVPKPTAVSQVQNPCLEKPQLQPETPSMSPTKIVNTDEYHLPEVVNVHREARTTQVFNCNNSIIYNNCCVGGKYSSCSSGNSLLIAEQSTNVLPPPSQQQQCSMTSLHPPVIHPNNPDQSVQLKTTQIFPSPAYTSRVSHVATVASSTNHQVKITQQESGSLVPVILQSSQVSLPSINVQSHISIPVRQQNIGPPPSTPVHDTQSHPNVIIDPTGQSNMTQDQQSSTNSSINIHHCTSMHHQLTPHVHHSTTQPHNQTTPHVHHSTTQPHNQTTPHVHHLTTQPPNQTTPHVHHSTTQPHNQTTSHDHHSTTQPHNQTTSHVHHSTTLPPNHITPHVHHSTTLPPNHTTPHVHHSTTQPLNHTTPHVHHSSTLPPIPAMQHPQAGVCVAVPASSGQCWPYSSVACPDAALHPPGPLPQTQYFHHQLYYS